MEGARRAEERGRLLEWTLGKVLREGRANRPLAAILRGQKPILRGPELIPLAPLVRIAGGEPGLKYSVPMDQWEREIAPILASDPEAQPPILARYGRLVADGNHRADAWRRQGLTHGWAIVWEDSDPVFRDWWTPFPPDASPTYEPRDVPGGILFAAVSRGETVGSFRLVRDDGGLELREFRVDPPWRGQRLGSRMLRVARGLMDDHRVRTTAPATLVRFFGETDFRPTGRRSEDLVELVREARPSPTLLPTVRP